MAGGASGAFSKREPVFRPAPQPVQVFAMPTDDEQRRSDAVDVRPTQLGMKPNQRTAAIATEASIEPADA